MMPSKQPGFSFIEIIVALAIIAVVTATSLSMWNYYARAKKSTTLAVLDSVKLAIDTYHADTGTYPTRLEDLIQKPSDAKIAARWTGHYLDGNQLPMDGYKQEIQYELKPKGSVPPYELYSWGGEEGSDPSQWIHVRR